MGMITFFFTETPVQMLFSGAPATHCVARFWSYFEYGSRNPAFITFLHFGHSTLFSRTRRSSTGSVRAHERGGWRSRFDGVLRTSEPEDLVVKIAECPFGIRGPDRHVVGGGVAEGIPVRHEAAPGRRERGVAIP